MKNSGHFDTNSLTTRRGQKFPKSHKLCFQKENNLTARLTTKKAFIIKSKFKKRIVYFVI